jgi:hypothetical protein
VARKKEPIIDLPLKIMLTSEGVEWFIRNHKQPKRLRMADNRLAYGLALSSFSAESLQTMINIDYIAAVEITRTEFSDKRREVIDLTKLIVYRILYRGFEEESYRMLLASPLIRRWNRAHPSRIIDEKSIFDRAQMDGLLASCSAELPLVTEDIESGLKKEIDADRHLGEEEKEILHHLCDRFVNGMRNITWCVLARSRSAPEYPALITQMCSLLRAYLAKTRISEYLALMITELLTYTEALHAMEIARKLFPKTQPTLQMLRSPKLRGELARFMEDQEDYLSLSYQVSSRTPSIGTQNRLRIVLFNRAREYRKVKEQIENKIGLDIKEKSLVEFYRRMPSGEMDTELGLYYLSFLHEECGKCNVHLDSNVSEIAASDLTVITLNLQFS